MMMMLILMMVKMAHVQWEIDGYIWSESETRDNHCYDDPNDDDALFDDAKQDDHQNDDDNHLDDGQDGACAIED